MRTVKINNLEIGAGVPCICIPVFGKTLDEIGISARCAQEAKPDLVEFRVDYYEKVTEADYLQRACELVANICEVPILCTFRSSREGGEREVTAQEYKEICINAMESGKISLLDVEVFFEKDVVTEILAEAKKREVPVVFSNHDFYKTPESEEIKGRLNYMKELGGAVAKIALMPEKELDVLRVMTLTRELLEEGFDIPIVAISMGKIGMLSRVAGELYGSAITFATAKEASAPGQISATKMRELLELVHEGQ